MFSKINDLTNYFSSTSTSSSSSSSSSSSASFISSASSVSSFENNNNNNNNTNNSLKCKNIYEKVIINKQQLLQTQPIILDEMPNTLTVHLDDKSFRTIQIELTPDYTCKQFLNNYASNIKNSYLIQIWRGQERRLNLDEKFYDILNRFGIYKSEIKFYLKDNLKLDSNIMKIPENSNNNNSNNINNKSTIINKLTINNNHTQDMNNKINIENTNFNYPSSQAVDLTLSELQEIAMRQQQQIEHNQQLLIAKEKRLKYLRQEELKRQQQFSPQQQNFDSSTKTQQNGNLPTQQQQQQQQQKQQIQMNHNNNNKENVINNQFNQELKLLKLKQLRNQLMEQKTSNSNMYSEVDLIKLLFADKERELYEAISKVSELTKQIDQLRKLKATNQQQQQAQFTSSNASELEKLKQELLIRNKLNEQQAKKIMQQHELFQQKQLEVLALDKRIEELQARIANKRILNQQIQTEFMQQQQQQNQQQQQQQLNNKQFNQQLTSQPTQVTQLTIEPANLVQPIITTSQHQQQQPQQQQQQISPSNVLFEDDIDNIKMKLQQQQFHQQHQQQQNSKNQPNGQVNGNSPTSFENHSISPSPSKIVPKFATKQEIANTYMNKFGSEAYQKYQETTKRLLQQQQEIYKLRNQHTNLYTQQQQQHQQQQQPQELPQTNIHSHIKQISIDSNDSSSNTSTANSISPPSATNELTSSKTQSQQQQPTTDQSALPSHLRLEFDKIKFIPDMVKTIKKRHSISDIEGSVHTVPPQLFQKMLEQHHKNSQQQQQQKPNATQSTTLTTSTTTATATTTPTTDTTINITSITATTINTSDSKLNSIKEADENTNNANNTKKENETKIQITETQVIMKKKKSIIKPPRQQQQQQLTTFIHSRRVNFDPHALLLDAAVEGELELVIKCSTLVKSVSEPNDEGITALHNSVCAGHFEIVKYLVEFGCDVNYADNDGWTSLHCAASCNNLQMVKFLIEHGASIFATTISDNETAVDKCEEDEDGFAGCSEYLLQMEEKLGTMNGGVVYALYDYEAENDDELTFKCFDQMRIVSKTNEYNDEGWWLAELKDKKGLVPRNYIGIFPRVKPGKYESTVC